MQNRSPLRAAFVCTVLALGSSSALAWDGPNQWAVIQAECDARFIGMKSAKAAAELCGILGDEAIRRRRLPALR